MLEDIQKKEFIDQEAYRTLLNAFAYAATEQALSTKGGLITLLSSIVDRHTTLYVEGDIIDQDSLRLIGAQSAPPETASFLVLQGNNPNQKSWQPNRGTLVAPHEGATVFICLDSNDSQSEVFVFSGPGIQTDKTLKLPSSVSQWFSLRESWVSEFPTGVDLVLVWGKTFMAIPRTLKVRKVS